MSGKNWKPLEAHASTKKFFRGEFKGRQALMIRFDNLEDRERFAAITKFLLSKKIPVPKLLPQHDEDAVVTEFVEGGLFSSEKKSAPYLEKILSVAGMFADISPDLLPKTFKLNRLDLDRLRFEMNFFFLNFCSSYLSEKPSAKVKDAIYKLAEELSLAPAVFAHRDYHSENIMVAKGSIYIVDYQDALLAPRCYDLASLYVDGYREPSASDRKAMMDRARESNGAGRAEFMKTALQRALKALGTFGYQVVQRNKERYRGAAVRTAGYLDKLASDETLAEPEAVDFVRTIRKKLT